MYREASESTALQTFKSQTPTSASRLRHSLLLLVVMQRIPQTIDKASRLSYTEDSLACLVSPSVNSIEVAFAYDAPADATSAEQLDTLVDNGYIVLDGPAVCQVASCRREPTLARKFGERAGWVQQEHQAAPRARGATSRPAHEVVRWPAAHTSTTASPIRPACFAHPTGTMLCS